ncbi:hypothetical protein [Bradyrhizobium sp. LTSP885]|uniref:hypothetical protein n=1 Tax=Bradyrhizobium sp. LTSP885 TaxID=1619232 RepID=UPI000AA98600|nr:hypothetical protein [Bradyrhizobium sp. LTSP885]
MRRYEAIIWDDETKPGLRVSIQAESLDDAKRKLESEYGEGVVFDLHNADDASRPR